MHRRDALIALAAPAFLAAPRRDKVPIAESGPTRPEFEPIDRMMREFMADGVVPGAALAVARRGRLAYARGFGLADRASGEPVHPRSLFRIASVSKPITSAAILHLVERGGLSLDARMVEILKLSKFRDPRMARVTIRNLLHHTGGWDREASFDPMFRSLQIASERGTPPPARPAAIVDFMMDRPLDFDPGSRYAYSNFGYCVLGRVVEAVAGRPYGDFVREAILKPIGVEDMRIGRTLPGGRAPREVRYESAGTAEGVVGPTIGRRVPWPYGGWYLEAMEAHGGWIASAPDLVRFATRIDRGRPPMLGPATVRTLFDAPDGPAGREPGGSPKPRFYACGWEIVRVGDRGRFNAFHSGSLDGTSSILVRRHDDFAWAALFNTRAGVGGREPASRIDGPIHRAVDAVRAWPGDDHGPA